MQEEIKSIKPLFKLPLYQNKERRTLHNRILTGRMQTVSLIYINPSRPEGPELLACWEGTD